MNAMIFDLDDTLYLRSDPLMRAMEMTFGSQALDGCRFLLASKSEATAELSDQEKAAILSAIYRKHSNEVYDQSMKGEITMEEMYIYRIGRTMEDLGVTITDEQALTFQKNYAYSQEHLYMHPEVEEMLTFLRDKGVFIGVITNGPAEHQKGKYNALSLERFLPYDHFLSSGEAGVSKPDPEIMRIAQARWNLDPATTWYIGDSLAHDISCAQKENWHTLWLNLPEPDLGGKNFNDLGADAPKAEVTVTSLGEMRDEVCRIAMD